MMACAYAAAFGAIQQMPRIVPGLAEVQQLPRTAQEQTISGVQSFQEFGGLAGRLLLAFLAAVIISRRRLLWLFQIPGLILLPIVFLFTPTVGLSLAQWGIFLVGMATIAQFSFWGNYLPRVYPTHLRGTGESFAANVGGRMLGTMAALVTVQLVTAMPGGSVPVRLAYASALVGHGRIHHRRCRKPLAAGAEAGRLSPTDGRCEALLLRSAARSPSLLSALLATSSGRRGFERHETVYGVTHGALLFCAIGFALGARSQVGLFRARLAAPRLVRLPQAVFYLLAPARRLRRDVRRLGGHLGSARIPLRVAQRTRAGPRGVARGLIAAVASGLAFYLISGIWRPFNPEGWDYAVHFAAWTVSLFPRLRRTVPRQAFRRHELTRHEPRLRRRPAATTGTAPPPQPLAAPRSCPRTTPVPGRPAPGAR